MKIYLNLLSSIIKYKNVLLIRQMPTVNHIKF
jgi:hypothetical protein